MVPEAIATVLGGARIGAVVMPLFSGYGAAAVRARLEDSGATVLVTCDAVPRRGRPVPSSGSPTRPSGTCRDCGPSWWSAWVSTSR
jgi:acetyl-CoA synthetase